MAFSPSADNELGCPTLPPLHTLDLPYGGNDQTHTRFKPQTPQPLTSSSTTSLSPRTRTPSPTPSNFSAYSATSFESSVSPTSLTKEQVNIRLIPSTLEIADAVLVVPPPLPLPYISASTSKSKSTTHSLMSESLSFSPISESEKARAILLVGRAVQQLRHPKRQISRGARVHPYRIIKTSTGTEREERKDSDIETCI